VPAKWTHTGLLLLSGQTFGRIIWKLKLNKKHKTYSHSAQNCNIYIQYVITEALEEVEEGVKVGGVRIPAVQFADDQAMVSHTIRGLQIIMNALQNTSEKYNMRINTNKTK